MMLPHGKFNPNEGQRPEAPAEQTQMRVNLADAEDILCEECGNNTFDVCLMLKKVSALLSPTGKQENIPVQTLACHKCGHINEDFLPKV